MLRLTLDPARARHDAAGVVKGLLAGTPSIAVNREAESILVNPVTLREEDDGLVASRLGMLLM